MSGAREQFEAMWPQVQGGEAIFEEWPHILHVRLRSAHWDEQLLLIQMEALPTPGFAQCQRQSAACDCAWDRIRCTEHGLCTYTWSLHCWAELTAAVIEQAATAIDGWSRAQYEALSNLITDWELDWISHLYRPSSSRTTSLKAAQQTKAGGPSREDVT